MCSLTGLLLISLTLAPLRAEQPVAKAPRTDPLGDPMPDHAVARLVTTRWRQSWYNVVVEPAKLESPWADLAKADAAAAHKAVWTFVGEPDRAIAFLGKHLQVSEEADNGDFLVPPGE